MIFSNNCHSSSDDYRTQRNICCHVVGAPKPNSVYQNGEYWNSVSDDLEECQTDEGSIGNRLEYSTIAFLIKPYNEKFDIAMLAVKSTENATKIRCSFRPNLDSLKRPSLRSTRVPNEANVVCIHVNNQGNLN
jgi:hypothetical protein